MRWPEALRKIRRVLLERRQRKKFFKQGVTLHQFGNYEISIPSNHATIGFMSRQPYRDLCIGIAAKQICEKYPFGTIVDIGANIGDTASIIASYAKNKMILIEASKYYFDFLQYNSKKFLNETVLINSFIGEGTNESGELKHWGGTAHFQPDSKASGHLIKTKRLREVVDENVTFIKIDTDGFDFKIISDSLDYLQQNLPAILFEVGIRNLNDLESADDTFSKLRTIGYTHFLIWDDAGFYLSYTCSLQTLKDFNRYLFKIWSYEQTTKSISNYDVLCLKAKDSDICNLILDYYRKY